MQNLGKNFVLCGKTYYCIELVSPRGFRSGKISHLAFARGNGHRMDFASGHFNCFQKTQ